MKSKKSLQMKLMDCQSLAQSGVRSYQTVTWGNFEEVLKLHDFFTNLKIFWIELCRTGYVKSPEEVRRALPANIVPSQVGPARPSMIPRRPKSLTSSIHTVQFEKGPGILIHMKVNWVHPWTLCTFVCYCNSNFEHYR